MVSQSYHVMGSPGMTSKQRLVNFAYGSSMGDFSPLKPSTSLRDDSKRLF